MRPLRSKVGTPELMAIDLFLEGTPKAWSRSQPIVTAGKFVGMRNTMADKAYKAMVARAFDREVSNRYIKEGTFPWPKPGLVTLKMIVLQDRPAHVPPDLSNLVKLVEDGLNRVAYQDDSQIVKLLASKVQSSVWTGTLVRLTFHEKQKEESL